MFSHINVIVTPRWRALTLVFVTQMKIVMPSSGHVINEVSLLPDLGESLKRGLLAAVQRGREEEHAYVGMLKGTVKRQTHSVAKCHSISDLHDKCPFHIWHWKHYQKMAEIDSFP